jgi:hypothetical protein
MKNSRTSVDNNISISLCIQDFASVRWFKIHVITYIFTNHLLNAVSCITEHVFSKKKLLEQNHIFTSSQTFREGLGIVKPTLIYSCAWTYERQTTRDEIGSAQLRGLEERDTLRHKPYKGGQ